MRVETRRELTILLGHWDLARAVEQYAARQVKDYGLRARPAEDAIELVDAPIKLSYSIDEAVWIWLIWNLPTHLGERLTLVDTRNMEGAAMVDVHISILTTYEQELIKFLEEELKCEK